MTSTKTRPKKKSLLKSYRDIILYKLLTSFAYLITRLPLDWALALGSGLGKLAYWLDHKDRQRALNNLGKAFNGKYEKKQLKQMVEKVFLNLTESFIELLFLSRPEYLFAKETIEIEGEEYLTEAFNKGKGVIFATAHLGNWELMGAYWARKGFPVNVIAREVRDQRYENFLARLRANCGVKVLHRGKKAFSMLRCLRKGEGLGILVDLYTHKGEGIWVDFFGQPAYTQTGIGALAWQTGAAIIPGFMVRLSRKQHLIKILPPLEPPTDKSEAEYIRWLVETCTKELESMIKTYPEQWIWMHKRWHRPSERHTKTPFPGVEVGA